nr:fibropellin-1-like [Lytechinus pictus]
MGQQHNKNGVFGGQKCGTIPENACPHSISEHTGTLVQLVPKYLTRDHPEYEVRTPPAMRDKNNLYCAHPACYSSPCLNGGTCTEDLFGYSCSCVGQYNGTHCEHPVCPDGWLYATTKCFQVRHSGNVSTYENAREKCASLPLVTLGNGKTTGPSMINIESIEEFYKIRPLLDGYLLWNHCKRSNGEWKCYRNRQGDLSSYRNWGENQPGTIPGEDCGIIYLSNGEMHDYPCNQPAAAVCQVII